MVGLGLGLHMEKQQKEALSPINQEIFNKRAALGASPLEKTLGTFLVAAPASYYYSAKQEAKARKGQPLSDSEDFVRRNPLMTAVAGTAFSRMIGKQLGASAKDLKTRGGKGSSSGPKTN